MITAALVASPVERLVRPPKSDAVNILSFAVSLSGGSNAANHPPPRAIDEDDSLRVGGRVHWLVRARLHDVKPRSARRPPHAGGDVTQGLNHAALATRNHFLP